MADKPPWRLGSEENEDQQWSLIELEMYMQELNDETYRKDPL